jgi:SNF2 family DNA or RNA helicase
VKRAIEERGAGRARITVLDALLKLRQICCHPGLLHLPEAMGVEGSAKLELFKETLMEILAEGHRVLVFSQFVEMLTVLRGVLEQSEVPYEYLDGRSRDRQARIDRFNAGSAPVFLISLKAGGTGLNLASADYVIHYDPWWNPAVEDQATDRAYRIGQTRPVFSYKLIARDTVEEKILSLQERKRELANSLLDSEGGIEKDLGPEDFEFLFEESAAL